MRDIDLLVDLRERFGHAIVDALMDQGSLTSAPLSDEARACARALLSPRVDSDDVPRVEIRRLTPDEVLVPSFETLSHMLDDERCSAPTHPTELALIMLARRSYPAFLASMVSKHEASWEPIRLRGLDAHRVAIDAIQDDDSFGPLLAADVMRSSFGDLAAWLRLYDACELLLYGAWRLTLLRGQRAVSDFVESVLEQVACVRTLARGQAAQVPVFLGFGNLGISSALDDGSVQLRPYPSSLNSLLDPADRLNDEGGGVIVERRMSSTFVALSKGERLLGAIDEPISALSSDEDSSIRHWADCFTISLMLSLLPAGLLSPHQVAEPISFPHRPELRWLLTGDPLCNATSHHFSRGWAAVAKEAIGLAPAILTRTEALFRLENMSVHVAVTRLSASLQESRRWSDCFLDAVIAWEALSGDCKDAVTLKLTAIMSRLVAAPGQRKQIREKVRTLYGKRSRVVHGGATPVTSGDLNAAVLIGLTALREIVDRYPALLETTSRFEALCLDTE